MPKKPKCPDYSEIYGADVVASMKELGISSAEGQRPHAEQVYDAMVVFAREKKRFPGTKDMTAATKLNECQVHSAIHRLISMHRVKRVSRGIYCPMVRKADEILR